MEQSFKPYINHDIPVCKHAPSNLFCYIGDKRSKNALFPKVIQG